MADQTVALDLRLTAEDALGAPVTVRLGDLQKADPSAGPGALDASVQAVRTSVDALRTQLGTPVPVSLGSVPLAAGAATEATLAAVNVKLGAPLDVADRVGRVLGHVSVDNFPATQPVSGSVAVSNLPATQAVSGTVNVGNLPATQAVSAASLPLPAGAATAARQDAEAAQLDALIAKDYATETSLQALSGKVGTPAADDMLSLLRAIAANTLLETTKTDVLQLTADQVNLNTDQVEAKLDTVSARIGTTGVAGSAVERIEAVRAAIAGTPAVSVSNWPATQPVSGPFLTDTQLRAAPVAVSGPLTDAALRAAPVPVDTELTATGALATEAKQDTMITGLGGGFPAALVGGRLDVNIGAMPNPLAVSQSGAWSVTADTELPAALAPSDADGNPTVPGVQAFPSVWTGSLWRRLVSPPAVGDGNALGSGLVNGLWLYNGATWDRLRDANSLAGAAGVGLLGAGNLGFDGANWQRMRSVNTGDAIGAPTSGSLGVTAFGHVYNAATWERLRTVAGSAFNSTMTTGLLASGLYIANGASWSPVMGSFSDGVGGNNAILVAPADWNGGSFDRHRNNLDGTALASAARTGTTSSADITNFNGDGAIVILRVSVVPGTAPSLTLAVEGKDPASGVYYALNATPTAVTAVGTYVYEVGEGASGAAGGGVTQRTAGQLPRTFRVTVTHGNANSVTYSVGYSVITA